MMLEVGKLYISGNGKLVLIERQTAHSVYKFASCGFYYTEDGKYFADMASYNDLVSEVEVLNA